MSNRYKRKKFKPKGSKIPSPRTPIRIGEAKNLMHGMILIDTEGHRWKVNGKPQTWKRDKGRVKVPLKHGLWTYGYLTEDNIHIFRFESGGDRVSANISRLEKGTRVKLTKLFGLRMIPIGTKGTVKGAWSPRELSVKFDGHPKTTYVIKMDSLERVK